jgi:hypothetical protein
MPVTAWEVTHANQRWGANGQTIIPAALADAVAANEGKLLVTYFGKPYVVRASDPQSVWDYYDSVIDPHGDRVALLWNYDPDPDPGGAIP